MREPTFDSKGFDRATFAPFVLHDCRATEWKDVRLTFDKWDLLHKLAGADSLDGYYLNGYGVEGLVKAALSEEGIDPDADGIHCNSEGDTCNVHFTDLVTATRAAAAAAQALTTREALARLVTIAREHGFED